MLKKVREQTDEALIDFEIDGILSDLVKPDRVMLYGKERSRHSFFGTIFGMSTDEKTELARQRTASSADDD